MGFVRGWGRGEVFMNYFVLFFFGMGLDLGFCINVFFGFFSFLYISLVLV